MDRVSVSVSLYEASVRAAIQKTVEIVGGHVSLEFMSAKDSHLIVPLAKGEKYKACERLNIVAVTADWLVDSVTAGTLLPEEKYVPPLPPDGENPQEQKVQKQIQNVSMKRPAPTNFLSRQQIQGVGKRPQSLRERAARLSAAAGNGKELGKGFGSMNKQLCKSVVPLDLNTILTSTGPPESGRLQTYKRVDVQTLNEPRNKAKPAVPAVASEKRVQNNEPSNELEAALAMVSGYLASIPDGRGAVAAANQPLPDLDTQLSPNPPNEKSPPGIDGMDMPVQWDSEADGFHKQQTEPTRRCSTRQKKKVADPLQDMDGSAMEMSQCIGYNEEPATLYARDMSPGTSSELLDKQSNAAAKEHLTRASSRLQNRKSWLESQPVEME